MEYFVYNAKLFVLIFVRITSLFFVAPFFSSDLVPIRIRAGLGLAGALVVFPALFNRITLMPFTNAPQLFFAVINQIIIGVSIGIMAQLFFSIFLISGQYYTIQMGFGVIRTIDPFSRIQASILGILESIIALIIFLSIDAHHYLFYAIIRSFKIFPIFTFAHFSVTMHVIVEGFKNMLYLGFVFALPVIGTVFLTTVIMGLLAKLAPQMNILMLGFPLKIGLGLITLMLLQPFLYRIIVDIFVKMMEFINNYLQLAGSTV